ncbi:hypothetical protein Cgig2_003260 [Carnegiea gigantea]|uniref:DUF4283 domain-containing protein n=1 Tax=Carnegiea gigantea TaxID=171969 RepID=A0A9Q1JL46_9CARY|nr:hypothetical protein Cgig2_003260 [Carnegiea gigantea]
MARGRRGRPRSVASNRPSLVPASPSSLASPPPEAVPTVPVIVRAESLVTPTNPKIHPVPIRSSYAQLVTQMKLINGIISAKLLKSDVKLDVLYWQNSVLCTVLGANPSFEQLKGFLNRIWANYSIVKILYVHKGAVEKWAFFFFDSKPLLVKSWSPSMDLQIEAISSLPLWIQLPALDIKYWGAESLRKIGSILGIPIKIDKFMKDKQVLRYARLLIGMLIEGPFPEYIDFFNDDDVLIRQQVTYEWIPTKCTHCKILRHSEDVRKKKGVIRTEWRKMQKPLTPVTTDSLDNPVNTPVQATVVTESRAKKVPIKTQQGDFTPVTRGASPSRLSVVADTSLPFHHNSFTARNDVPNLLNNVGLIGLLETKIKEQKVDTIAANIFRGWNRAHNFSISNGRIWVAWKTSAYTINILRTSDRFIHCAATQMATNISFHITFIYGHNHENQRQPIVSVAANFSLFVGGLVPSRGLQ